MPAPPSAACPVRWLTCTLSPFLFIAVYPQHSFHVPILHTPFIFLHFSSRGKIFPRFSQFLPFIFMGFYNWFAYFSVLFPFSPVSPGRFPQTKQFLNTPSPPAARAKTAQSPAGSAAPSMCTGRQSSSASTSMPSRKRFRLAFPFCPLPWRQAISERTSWKGNRREAYWVKISLL